MELYATSKKWVCFIVIVVISVMISPAGLSAEARPVQFPKDILEFCGLPPTFPVQSALYFKGSLHCCSCGYNKVITADCRFNEPRTTVCGDVVATTLTPDWSPATYPLYVTPCSETFQNDYNFSYNDDQVISNEKILPCDTTSEVVLTASLGASLILNIVLIAFCLKVKRDLQQSGQDPQSHSSLASNDQPSDSGRGNGVRQRYSSLSQDDSAS